MSTAARIASDARARSLAAALAQHRPLDDEEREALTHLAGLLAGPVDPFARSTLPAHVTASAVVFDPSARVVLLHLHRRLQRWLQPGGHVELGERPEDAALRETHEETGVVVRHAGDAPRIVHLDRHPGPDGHIHLDLRYLLLADRDAPLAGSGETTGEGPGATLRWATLRELPEIADPSLARAITALDRSLDEQS
jgi:8-oxo-dGTP pyrophosphatase MutT (NUDIX family)